MPKKLKKSVFFGKSAIKLLDDGSAMWYLRVKGGRQRLKMPKPLANLNFKGAKDGTKL